VINEAGCNNAFCYFRYDREVGDRTIVTELVDFLSPGEMTDSLRMGWN